jgi:hypothetical protein
MKYLIILFSLVQLLIVETAQAYDFNLVWRDCKTIGTIVDSSPRSMTVSTTAPYVFKCTRRSKEVTCDRFDDKDKRGDVQKFKVYSDSPPLLALDSTTGGTVIIIHTTGHQAAMAYRDIQMGQGVVVVGAEACHGSFITESELEFDKKRKEEK